MNTATHKIPKRLGKYQVIEKLATGSMGVVYEGYDPIAERPVAIKVSLSEHIKDKQQARRFNELFVREAKTGSLLHHPNIMEVYDCGVDEGRHYIVMELVKHARTLKDYISEEDLLSPEEALDLIIQCAEGLKYAHVEGVIHRDIKPANILVTEDMKIKIADFSIAFVTQQDFEMTMPTGFVGSPRYMSPEQVQEDIITQQTDLYSLGVVMYELLTGKHPFEAASFSRLIYKVVNEDPPDPLIYKPNMQKNLATYILHALKKDPSKRFKSAAEMSKYLRRVFPSQNKKKRADKPLESKSDAVLPIISEQNLELLRVIQGLGLFADIDEADVRLICNDCLRLNFNDGDVITQQGERDEGLYILASGKLSIADINVGDSFGEIACLSNMPHPISIKSNGKTEVLHLKKELVDQLSSKSQAIVYRRLAETVSKRFIEKNNETSVSELS